MLGQHNFPGDEPIDEFLPELDAVSLIGELINWSRESWGQFDSMAMGSSQTRDRGAKFSHVFRTPPPQLANSTQEVH